MNSTGRLLTVCKALASQDVQINVTGAIQSLSFQAEGRIELREADLLPRLLPLADHASAKVHDRRPL